MIFQKFIRDDVRPITSRRLAAARRALQRQADAYALVPEFQPTETPAERCTRFDRETSGAVRRWRDLQAKHWRSGRAQFRALAPELRAQVAARFWGNRFMPKTATYLCEVIRSVTQENPL